MRPFLSLSIFLLGVTFTSIAQTWQYAGPKENWPAKGNVSSTDIAISPSGIPYIIYQSDYNNSYKAAVLSFDGVNWGSVGSPSSLSSGEADYTSIAFSPSGILHAVYSDGDNDYKITVKTFDGTNWGLIGTAGFSQGHAYYNNLVFHSDGTPFVAYSDASNSSKVTVKSFSGSNWNLVGADGFSTGEVDYLSLALSPSGIPYVVFEDYDQNYKATVMNFSGSSWGLVGPAGFTAGTASYPTLAFNTAGVPYVAYENNSSNNYRATVVSFTGTAWSVAGIGNISSGSVDYIDFAFSPSGVPYVIYKDYDNGSKVSVKKLSGTSWVNVGPAGFSGGDASYIKISFSPGGIPYVIYEDSDIYTGVVKSFSGSNWNDIGSRGITQGSANEIFHINSPSGVPFMVYKDVLNGNKGSVLSFDGSNWSSVGPLGFTSDYIYDPTLAFSPSGVPFVAFTDNANNYKATVMSFSGAGWNIVGNQGFTADEADYPSINFSPAGIPYVAYSDFGNSQKISVMKLNGNIWGLVGTAGFSDNDAYSINLAFSKNGVPFVAYTDSVDKYTANVKSFSGSNWVTVGNKNFSIGSAYYLGLAFSPSGIPNVVYSDGGQNSARATVMSCNGGNWASVGDAGFSAGKADYTNLAFSPSGTPYVIYEDEGNHNKATVRAYKGSSWEIVGQEGFSDKEVAYTNISVDNNGRVFVVYQGWVGSPVAQYFDLLNQTILGFAPFSVANYGDPQINLSGVSATSSLPVTFISSDNAIATVIDSKLSILYPGVVTITAFQSGNGFFNSAKPVSHVLTIIGKAPQTISFGSIPLKIISAGSFTLTATGSSGLPLTFSSSDPSVASISGNVVTLLNIGITTITASQTGNSTYLAATPVSQVLTVAGKLPQSIIFETVGVKPVSLGTFYLNATVNSGLPITFSSSNSSVATVADNKVTILSVGVTSITATQLGSDTYMEATPVTRVLTITEVYSFTGLITQSLIPSAIIDSQSSNTFSIEAANTSYISSVEFYYKPITSDTWKTGLATLSGTTYTFNLNIPNEEIGVEGYFLVNAWNGQQLYGDTSEVYLNYDKGISVSGLDFGEAISNYNVVSFPYDLGADSSVALVYENTLGSYDNTKWRLFRFNATTQKNEEYSQSFQGVSPGRGYWLIVKDSINMTLPAGKALHVSATNPFVQSLQPGWNLIGNPYLFNVLWSDVQAANLGVGELITYDKGFQSNSSTLKKLSGGYIFSSVPGIIKIPVIKNSTVNGGRISARYESSSVDAAGNWLLPLTVEEDGVSNKLAGIGMHLEASENYDKRDLPSLSSPFPVAAISFPIRDPLVSSLNRSVVPVSSQYTWNIGSNSDKAVLSWDVTLASKLNHEIWLVDNSSNKAVDMKKTGQYKLSANMKIAFGNKEYIENQLSGTSVSINSIYPNPTKSHITIDLYIPKNQSGSSLKITIYDMLGKPMVEETHQALELNQSIEISLDALPIGMYFVEVLNDGKKSLKKFVISQ